MKNQESRQHQNHSSSRRKLLTVMGLLPFASGIWTNVAQGHEAKVTAGANAGELPAKNLFAIKGTYLNAAYTHPMSIHSAEKIKEYLDFRQVNGRATQDIDSDRNIARSLFARLINAEPDEISWVPSTTVGENLIVNDLGIPGTTAHVVTDAYHFDGSIYLYGELAKQGVNVTTILPKNNRIDVADYDVAIKPGTKLVALSLVSMINGFQHDLKAICDIAHSRGALVYADIIQAAGAVPIDVKASGVDFCACATYKWLMGDFGAGFLYVRGDRLHLLKRTQYGYRQLKDMESHILPFDAPGNSPFDWVQGDKTRNYFEVGTLGNAAIPALNSSLTYLLKTGVDNIQRYRQPLIDKLQQELPKLGYRPMTPENSTSPIVSFAFKDAAAKLQPKLDAAGINIQVYQNRFRISPSIYNTVGDIDQLIKVLS